MRASAAVLLSGAALCERKNPFLLPGVAVRTTPANYFPITKSKMVRYRCTRWVLFGPLVNAR
jgi:hypothetical protein